jgi:hypothetical protein
MITASGAAHPARSPESDGNTIGGTLRAARARPLVGAAFALVPEADRVPPLAAPDVAVWPDGRFLFRNVVPGRYVIRARGQTESRGPVLFAMASVTVEDRPVVGVDMLLERGGSIEGAIVSEAVRTLKPAGYDQLRVRVPFADGSSFGEAPGRNVAAGGRFRIAHVMPGSHRVVVEGLPSPWMVKCVTLRGRDITTVPFDISQTDHLKGVRIILTDARPGRTTPTGCGRPT